MLSRCLQKLATWKSLLLKMIFALRKQERNNLDILICAIGLYKHCQDKVLKCIKNVFGELSLDIFGELQAVWSLPLAFAIKIRLHLEKTDL